MAKGFGKRRWEEVINTRESGYLIKKKVMVFLPGLTGVFTKETFPTTLKKAQDRYNTLMAPFSEDSGMLINLLKSHFLQIVSPKKRRIFSC